MVKLVVSMEMGIEDYKKYIDNMYNVKEFVQSTIEDEEPVDIDSLMNPEDIEAEYAVDVLNALGEDFEVSVNTVDISDEEKKYLQSWIDVLVVEVKKELSESTDGEKGD